MRYIPPLKKYLPITQLSQQRYIWAYTRIQHLRAKTTCDDWSSLINRDISNKYTITVRNKFEIFQDISVTSTPNDEYEYFANAHMKTAAECRLTQPRAKESSMGGTSS